MFHRSSFVSLRSITVLFLLALLTVFTLLQLAQASEGGGGYLSEPLSEPASSTGTVQEIDLSLTRFSETGSLDHVYPPTPIQGQTYTFRTEIREYSENESFGKGSDYWTVEIILSPTLKIVTPSYDVPQMTIIDDNTIHWIATESEIENYKTPSFINLTVEVIGNPGEETMINAQILPSLTTASSYIDTNQVNNELSHSYMISDTYQSNAKVRASYAEAKNNQTIVEIGQDLLYQVTVIPGNGNK